MEGVSASSHAGVLPFIADGGISITELEGGDQAPRFEYGLAEFLAAGTTSLRRLREVVKTER